MADGLSGGETEDDLPPTSDLQCDSDPPPEAVRDTPRMYCIGADAVNYELFKLFMRVP